MTDTMYGINCCSCARMGQFDTMVEDFVFMVIMPRVFADLKVS